MNGRSRTAQTGIELESVCISVTIFRRIKILAEILSKPGRILSGLLFLAFAGNTNGELAESLWREGLWSAARIESLRMLQSGRDPPRYQAIQFLCEFHLQFPAAEQNLQPVVHNEQVPDLFRIDAAWTLGRQAAIQARYAHAVSNLTFTFRHTPDPQQFLLAGCLLANVLREAPELQPGREGLIAQLNTSNPLWTRDLRKQAALTPPKDRRTSPWTWPARAVIGFYRRNISPAIGARCSLHPSCSEYAMEAMRRHGLLGLAMYADRGIREPDVIRHAEQPLRRNGRTLYADPIDLHDGWMKRKEFP